MKQYQKILVPCPGGAVTGGPEALHQLVDAMREAGLPAFIVYIPTSKRFEVPPPYRKYNAPQAALEDAPGNLIIYPEVNPSEAMAVQHADAALWWLSLENFLERRHINKIHDKLRYWKRVIKGQRPWNGAKGLHRIIHLSQTQHSTDYLRSCGIEPVPLIDCINEEFLTDRFLDKTSHKEDVILFNPTKGKKVTDRLIAAYPQWRFQPLRGLNRDQLSEKLYQAKLYIDFGHHPGRDRMPREAAMHGCCLITGILGSAGNNVDLPIPRKYKLDSSQPDFVQRFGALAQDIFSHFDQHFAAMDDYRQYLKSEPRIFRQQIRDYFLGEAKA